MRDRREQLLGHAAMLAFSALVAGSFSLGAMVANDIAPIALNAARFVLGTFVVGALAAAAGKLPRGLPEAPWRYLVLGGLFGSYFVLMFEGLKTAPPVSAAAVFTLMPIVTALAGWLILRQFVTARMALALAVGAAGALWVIFRADLSALVNFHLGRGEAIYFVGCVAHALYTVFLRKLNRGEPGIVVVFYVMVFGAVMLSSLGAPAIAATEWSALPSMVWFVIGYTAIVSGAGTFWLLQYAAQRIPGAKVMAYNYLTPSWVILLELALGHEMPPALVFPGIALTVVALVMLLKDEGH
ncbi:EamA-like transporter family protein [Meinhardsimonia xiamenensis]|jgi:drug/metabolite transporter (DMT)-like permease|uniref:EamA-like transporter family protein n=1 Tax=Meinhardsimonia xiamenensis TaxID=990712 RepID=A0A1G8YK41_9RHOB|nr:DMT family transporter [Meinhardsimonia xiamenensis]PRX37334.1 EamA-like transporter family protein [Meinhardsimonia xiamenensis]SDK03131.1 EamA-like transporter family protein [Meinhardsimonia xiamenensis]